MKVPETASCPVCLCCSHHPPPIEQLDANKMNTDKKERKETRIQINDLDQKEEMNIQPEQNEKTRIQKKWEV